MERLLHIEGMSIGHEGRELYGNICFDVHEGECIMLCGANGSGKTTLLKSLMNGRDDICMIPSRVPKIPGFTLQEFIRISCYNRSGPGGRISPELEEDIKETAITLGLGTMMDRDISTLSDGEFQKGCIAAALARKCSIIMLDEPTAFLDAENRISVLECLKEVCRTPVRTGIRPAVIFSTHDLYDGLHVADKVLALGADSIFRQSSENMEDTVSSIFETFYNFGVHFKDHGKETIPD